MMAGPLGKQTLHLQINLRALLGMTFRISHAAALGAAFVLAGCSFASESLWPSLAGEDPQPSAAQTGQPVAQQPAQPAQPAGSAVPPPPALGTTDFTPPPITPGTDTGTFVGRKVAQMRQELSVLQNKIRAHNQQLQQIRNTTTANSQRYHGTMAAITTRLQLGTTPGNPVLVRQWNEAQVELERLNSDIAAMNSLANEVSADSAMSGYLLEATRAAYGLSGAIDEDHRQLAILEDETNRTVVLIDRLLNELSEDVSRQTAYVSNERANLTTMALAVKNGELYGASLVNRAYASAAPLASSPPPQASAAPLRSSSLPSSSASIGSRRPLVVIRFDRPDVPYQSALYNAVSRALERRPQSQFDLVAVAPNRGTPAQVALSQNKSRRHAEQVLRTLTDMGLPPSRVNLQATTSTAANVNEVHIYLR
jgi:hypothetical protein